MPPTFSSSPLSPPTSPSSTSLRRSLARRAQRSAELERKLREAPRYAAEVNSIPSTTREALLAKASTPLLVREVFLRRRNLVLQELHVLLVCDSLSERYHLREELLKLGYIVTNCPSGKEAKYLLERQASDFHVVMLDSQLQTGAEGPGVHGLLFWARGNPAYNEVAFIVMAPTTWSLPTATLAMKLGATELLGKPIMKDALLKLRKMVGDAQNMHQQRNTRKAMGGTRLVTTLLGRREWLQHEMMEELAKLNEEPPSVGKKEETDLRATHGTIVVLLVHLASTTREVERRDTVRQQLKDAGFQVVAARSIRDGMAALSTKGIDWAMIMIDFRFDFAMGVGMLKEIATRQILLPVLGLHDDRSLDVISRVMKTGVCDMIVYPFARGLLKGLTKHLLTASELTVLQDQAKRIAVMLDSERQRDMQGRREIVHTFTESVEKTVERFHRKKKLAGDSASADSQATRSKEPGSPETNTLAPAPSAARSRDRLAPVSKETVARMLEEARQRMESHSQAQQDWEQASRFFGYRGVGDTARGASPGTMISKATLTQIHSQSTSNLHLAAGLCSSSNSKSATTIEAPGSPSFLETKKLVREKMRVEEGPPVPSEEAKQSYISAAHDMARNARKLERILQRAEAEERPPRVLQLLRAKVAETKLQAEKMAHHAEGMQVKLWNSRNLKPIPSDKQLLPHSAESFKKYNVKERAEEKAEAQGRSR
ncbi:hypothetical protein AB1Y20_008194 [Prymnesium parvum]|uniref:Response regulatory domain-containing protein n=1 Tax=Prymnesium parvum TaxID=97485 RepID=A0AB34IWC8_PRYPA